MLSRDPERLADWYQRHLGWELGLLPDEGYYTELYFREDGKPEQRQHLVFAIMPGDPDRGEGHIINYRVDDLESVVEALRQDGVEVSPIEVGPDAEGKGKFARLRDPEGHRIGSITIQTGDDGDSGSPITFAIPDGFTLPDGLAVGSVVEAKGTMVNDVATLTKIELKDGED